MITLFLSPRWPVASITLWLCQQMAQWFGLLEMEIMVNLVWEIPLQSPHHRLDSWGNDSLHKLLVLLKVSHSVEGGISRSYVIHSMLLLYNLAQIVLMA